MRRPGCRPGPRRSGASTGTARRRTPPGHAALRGLAHGLGEQGAVRAERHVQDPAERPRRVGEGTEDVRGHRPAREPAAIRVPPVDGRGLPVDVPVDGAPRRTDPHPGQRASLGSLGLVTHLGVPAAIGERHPEVVQGAPTAQEHAVAPLVGEGQATSPVDVEVEVVGPEHPPPRLRVVLRRRAQRPGDGVAQRRPDGVRGRGGHRASSPDGGRARSRAATRRAASTRASALPCSSCRRSR